MILGKHQGYIDSTSVVSPVGKNTILKGKNIDFKNQECSLAILGFGTLSSTNPQI